VGINVISKDFTVRWDKQNWEFKVVPLSTDRRTTTYHGKIEKVFFLVKRDFHEATYTIQWDDMTHSGYTFFESAIVGEIQTIMANRAGLSQYERHRKNYATSTTATPTKLHIGNAQIYVTKFSDNSRWWYEATSNSKEYSDWSSKLFKPEIEPSKEHLLKQIIKGDFVFCETNEVVVPFSLPHENGEKEVQSISLPHEINGESE
jgi:hypothetical protein